jgi:hypothetical protein
MSCDGARSEDTVGLFLSLRGAFLWHRAEEMKGELAVMEPAFTNNTRALEAVRALAFDVQGTCVDFY